MANLSVCIEMFWPEDKPEGKIRRVKDAGYSAAEFWGWENKDLDAIEAAVEETGVRIATFCMSAPRPLVDPGAADELLRGLERSAEVAVRLGTDRLILTTGNERKAERFEVTRRTVVRNLRCLLPELEARGLTLCIEPLNPIRDHLGYWLTRMPDAADIAMELASPNIKILMDLYHQQLTEGNLIENLRQYIGCIGHFHCAGVPGRCELVGGELDFRSIFAAIDATGYDAHVGLEFRPAGDTSAALAQARSLLADAAGE